MDELVKSSIELVERKKKAVAYPADTPISQPYYTFSSSDGKWNSTDPETSTKATNDAAAPHSLTLYSWNIDFMLPFAESRMAAALRHLESLVSAAPSTTATVIFFAECLESDLKLIAEDQWVRKTFHITDLDGKYWTSGHYGTTTLLDRRLPVDSCFRVHYSKTRMERDGHFVDIRLDGTSRIRFCNTHLESLAFEPPYRPPQVELCAQYLKAKEVDGGIMAGDFNAIQDFDKHLHSDNGLKDAYLELGGREEDAQNGHTWGQQAATAQRERFGTSRMDKVFYTGRLACKSFERFGAGVELEGNEAAQIMKLGFDRPWITDHFGVKVVFEVAAIQSKV
jgi:tyrosyl-DNA phosphodiesterase 2